MASKPQFGSAQLRTLFDDLLRCEIRLYNELNDRIRAEHGAVGSQFGFLRFIRDHPGARVADLAADFAIGIGATSKGVDRMEKLGWIQREPNPDDRRSSLLTLTDSGREVLAAAEPTWDAGLEELIGQHIDQADLAAAAGTLARLRAALEAERVGMPTG